VRWALSCCTYLLPLYSQLVRCVHAISRDSRYPRTPVFRKQATKRKPSRRPAAPFGYTVCQASNEWKGAVPIAHPPRLLHQCVGHNTCFKFYSERWSRRQPSILDIYLTELRFVRQGKFVSTSEQIGNEMKIRTLPTMPYALPTHSTRTEKKHRDREAGTFL
jgi:hypothetical protein